MITEELFQRLFNSLSEGVILIDPDGQIFRANPAAEHILGLEQSEITKRNYVSPDWNIIRPDGTKMPPEEMAGPRAMKEQKPIKNVEMGVERSDGSVRWINVNASPITDETGELEGVIGTFENITEQKKAEENLRELHRVGAEIVGMNDKEKVLRSATEAAEHVLDFNKCNIGLIEGDQLVPRFSSIKTGDYKLEELSLNKDNDKLAVETALNQENHLIADLRDTKYCKLKEKGFRSALSVSLGEYGVFQAVSKKKKNFDNKELKFAELLANYVINALDRLETERKLRENQERLEVILANSPTVIYMYSIDSKREIKITYVNDKINEILGFEPEDLLGESDFHLGNFHPEVVSKIKNEKIPQLMSNGSIEMEYRYQDVNGDYHWLFDRQTVLSQEDGVLKVIGAWQDITERKKAEEKLKENEEKLSNILDNVEDVIWSLSWPDMSLNYISPSAEEVFGYSEEEFRNDPSLWEKVTHPDDKPLNKEALDAVEENGKSIREVRIVRSDGSVRWIRDKAKMVYGDEGDPARVEGITSDITERKKAEEERNMLLKNTEEQVWYMKDPQTYGRANKAHAEFLGLDKSEIKNRDIFQITSTAEEAEIRIEGNKEVFEKMEPIKTEEWVKNGEGEARLLSINKSPKLEDGEVQYVVCTAHDITERRFQSNLHHLISELTADLIATEDQNLDKTLNAMLEEVGQFVNSDRAYFFQFTEDGEIMNNTHEWCAAGIEPQKDNLQNLPSDTFPWWMKKLENNEDILVPQVSEMKDEAINEREILEEQDIKSVIVVPVSTGNELLGFVGFDAVRQRRDWTQNISSLLHIFATAIANSLSRRREKELQKNIDQLENTLSGVTNALSAAVEMRDSYTAGHQKNVAEIAVKIAKRMNFSEEQVEQIRTAGLLHDIGKISTPPAILNETGELGDQEFEIIKRHPINGYEILSDIDFRGPIDKIVLQHHERLDGSGYPKGLTSDEILPEAKVLAIADVFEAMTSHRPYRPAYSVDETLNILDKEQSGDKGPKFDKNALRSLKQLIKKGEIPIKKGEIPNS